MEDLVEYLDANSNTHVGGFIVHNDNNRACKIKERTVSKTGKHGHMKIHLVLEDIFTFKKYVTIVGSSDKIMVPKIKKAEYQLVDISDDGFVTYINDKAEPVSDLHLGSNDICDKIRAEFANGHDINIVVVSAMNESHIMDLVVNKN